MRRRRRVSFVAAAAALSLLLLTGVVTTLSERGHRQRDAKSICAGPQQPKTRLHSRRRCPGYLETAMRRAVCQHERDDKLARLAKNLLAALARRHPAKDYELSLQLLQVHADKIDERGSLPFYWSVEPIKAKEPDVYCEFRYTRHETHYIVLAILHPRHSSVLGYPGSMVTHLDTSGNNTQIANRGGDGGGGGSSSNSSPLCQSECVTELTKMLAVGHRLGWSPRTAEASRVLLAEEVKSPATTKWLTLHVLLKSPATSLRTACYGPFCRRLCQMAVAPSRLGPPHFTLILTSHLPSD